MDFAQGPIPVIPVALSEGHTQGVGVERQPEDSGLLQHPPHDSASPLGRHEPFPVAILNLAFKSFAVALLFFLPLQTMNVGWVIGHG